MSLLYNFDKIVSLTHQFCNSMLHLKSKAWDIVLNELNVMYAFFWQVVVFCHLQFI